MDFLVVLHKAEEGGYWVEVPALPGCYSQGETIEEALEGIREAIALHLEAMAEEGELLPDDTDWIIAHVSIERPRPRKF